MNLDSLIRESNPVAVDTLPDADSPFGRAIAQQIPIADKPSGIRYIRRPRRLLLVGGAAAATVAACIALVVALVVPTATHRGAPEVQARTHSVAVIRARLVAALDSAGNDVLEITRSGACNSTTWMTPFDVQAGGEFRERTETTSCSGTPTSGEALDMTVENVTPYQVLTPADVGNVVTPGGPVIPGKSVGVPRNVGEWVCGNGSETGFNTTFNSSWQGSAETLRIGVPATPELLRNELAAGSLELIGNTTVNGEAAVELSLLIPPASVVGSSSSVTIWLDASSYLPIREVQQFQAKQLPGAPPTTSQSTEQDYTFLPPTAANLALVQLSVPSGLAAVTPPGTFIVPSCSLRGATSAGNSGTSGNTGTGASGA
jgi:hypothetical protein